MPTTPTVEQLHHAITIAEQIQALQNELTAIVGGSSSTSTPVLPEPEVQKKARGRKKGRKMTAETRAKMAAAQQARHGKKGGSGGAAVKPVRGKRTFSPEAEAKMAKAARKRWAKVK